MHQSPHHPVGLAQEADVRERAVEHPHALQAQLRQTDNVAEKGLRLTEHLMLGAEPPLHLLGEARQDKQGEEIHPQQNAGPGRLLTKQRGCLLLAEGDVALFLAGGALEQTDNGGLVDGVDEGLEDGEHHALAHGHFAAHVLGEVSPHAPGGEPADHAVCRPRPGAEQRVQPEEDTDMGQLLGGLPGKEGRRLKRRCPVQPVAALDARHLAIEELVEDPSQQGGIPRQPEPRPLEVEAQGLAGDQHGVERTDTDVDVATFRLGPHCPDSLTSQPAPVDALALHHSAYVADAHADSLMWNRDLRARQRTGHLDFVRLREAGVRLQAFTVVTEGAPWVGGFPLFAAWRRWPRRAASGAWARAQFQIGRLEEFCGDPAAGARIVHCRADLDAADKAGLLACVLGVEGGQALEGRVGRVTELARRGVRFLGLTHLSANALGGSATPGMRGSGLTGFGAEVVAALAAAGLAVDVAHASPALLDALLLQRQARVFCSHTGVRGAAPHWRNLPDAALRALAERGGVVGILFGTVYLGGRELEDVARHVEHALDVAGEDAVCLGSDFDGFVPLPRGMRDVGDLPRLTELLLARGHPWPRVEKVLGRNLRRFFAEVLG
jgi:membrane dipeptidase